MPTASNEQDNIRREGPLAGFITELPTERLAAGGRQLLDALAKRALRSLSSNVDKTARRFSDYAEPGDQASKPAPSGGETEKGSRLGSMLGAGWSGTKEKVQDALSSVPGGGSGRDGTKMKFTNIVEDIDVGVPVRVAYNQWTQFQDFPEIMKKVERADQESDEEEEQQPTWKAQVLWSHRSWHATVLEQVPDQRIVWESSGEKGHVNGTVTFHEITPDLTRILVVLIYHQQGFVEGTGNLWRAAGRRARLEIKHFRRHVMTETILNPDGVEGWRGEIRDGRVVKTHEATLREEEELAADDYDTGRHEQTESGEEETGERPAHASG